MFGVSVVYVWCICSVCLVYLWCMCECFYSGILLPYPLMKIDVVSHGRLGNIDGITQSCLCRCLCLFLVDTNDDLFTIMGLNFPKLVSFC